MKIRFALICSVFLLAAGIFPSAGYGPLHAAGAENKKLQKKESPAPLVDFSSWTRSGNDFSDKTGNAVLTGGETIQETEGPFGGKAWYFDGKKTSVSMLDFSKIAKQFDGFAYSLSFWFRSDGIQLFRWDPSLSGNTPGLGLDLHGNGVNGIFKLPCVGSSVNAWFAILPNQWNHIALVYSVEQRIEQVFINGYPHTNRIKDGMYFPLKANASGKERLGAFKGAIANLKMWDKPVDPAQFLEIGIPRKEYESLRKDIETVREMTARARGGELMADNLQKELDAMAAKKKIPFVAYNRFLKHLHMVQKLIPAVNTQKKNPATADFPFALLQSRAISGEIRTPRSFPSEVAPTNEITAVAAKDEYTSATFFVFPYRNVKRVDFQIGDLKDADGHIIPASEVELKHVQCWFQPSWNSYFNGHGWYVPGLLLNDPELLRIDEEKAINYLRINYPDGVRYCNICEPGTLFGMNARPRFAYEFEPVWDADTFQPVDIDFGRNRQIWLDIHAPKNAKAGVYRGKIRVKVEGAEIGSFSLALRVLPFELPPPGCQFDPDAPYFQDLTGVPDVASQTALLKDREAAIKRCRDHIMNLKKHSILHGAVPNANTPENLKEMIGLYKDADMPIVLIDGGNGFVNFSRIAQSAQIPLSEYMADGVFDSAYRKFQEGVDKLLATADEMTGRHDTVHFYGIDEAQWIGAFRMMSPFRDYFLRKGAGSLTTGWEDNYSKMPSFETFHTTAARVERKLAKNWHAIRGEITAYAAPFIGPDNPRLMRYSHGVKMYRNNYNGWFELSYGDSRYHTWNNLFGYDKTYRLFRFVVDTVKGPIINTVAFCGMREGQDDVRYATKLMLLARECMDSGDMEKILAGRKAVLWFRNLPFPVPDDLDAMRAGMVHHILEMMKVLGKDIKS